MSSPARSAVGSWLRSIVIGIVNPNPYAHPVNAGKRRFVREPGKGSYAKTEIERRFLVTASIPRTGEQREIRDLYLDGLRMRLRCVSAKGVSVYKLTQKVRVASSDPFEVALTTMYLSAQEYDRLSQLPGKVLTKTRSLIEAHEELWAFDSFHGHLAGLVLAEIELPHRETQIRGLPLLGREVTHEDRFSGGWLAQAGNDEAAQLLSEIS